MDLEREVAYEYMRCLARAEHLAGILGISVLSELEGFGWINRVEATRAVELTQLGKKQFKRGNNE